MKSRNLPLLLLIVGLLLALPLAAQESEAEPPAEEEPGESQEGVFFETFDVSVVNVEVFVTDKQGEPITGLTREDFEILEDKRPVQITNFYAVEAGRPVAGGAEQPQVEIEQQLLVEKEELPFIPYEQRLNLIVYVDNFNIRPFNRNRVFRRIREFLYDNVGSEDRVMLVSYDRSLHYRHPFTSDSSLVANALFDLEKLTGYAVHRDSERRDVLRDISEADGVGEVEWRVKQYAESLYNDLSFTLSALKDFVDTLAGLEGRKALLYVSDGLEMRAGEDLFHALQQRFYASGVMNLSMDYDLSRSFRELAARANANRVTFYTLDAAGLRVHSSATVERSYASPTPGMDSFVDSIYISNLQSPLLFLAEKTGGQAIINSNDVGPGLERVARDFNTYYSLGYVPSHVGDGRYHSIEVKVKDKGRGVRVRHREGYRDKSLNARMADITTSSLLYGFQRNPMEVGLEVGSGQPGDSGHFVVSVLVEIPLSQVVLIPQEDFHFARLKLFFSAMDEKGGMSDVQEVPLQIRIPNDQVELARSESYHYKVDLQMRQGGHRVAVGVRDEVGANHSFVTRTVLVGSG